jgi:hypothetical protein
MYPPKVTDQQIIAMIRALSASGTLPSGVAFRAALEVRYRSRGGVARIYRLLDIARGHEAGASTSAIGSRLLDVENQNLRMQLKELYQRETLHQAHWNREVGQLRERLGALEQRVTQTEAVPDSLRKEVQAAETRAGQLEVLIRAFGPAAYRSGG